MERIRTGWSQKWASPKRIKRNRRLDIQQIVRGPFSSPRLLQAQPFIAVSPDERETSNVKQECNVRRGIPDTWREYLATKGLCGTIEASVLKKNLVPSCVRCFATDRLWNDIGLPLMQGIPDPWKNKCIQENLPIKTFRRHSEKRAKNIFTEVSYNYGGDADMENNAMYQFDKDRMYNNRHAIEEMRNELNPLKKKAETAQGSRCKWGENRNDDHKKKKGKDNGNCKNTICCNRDSIVNNGRRKYASSNWVNQREEKLIDMKCHYDKSVQNGENTCTLRLRKMDKAGQAKVLFKDKAHQVQNPSCKKNIRERTRKVPQVLPFHSLPQNCRAPLLGMSLSDRVLCQECECLYRNNGLQIISPTKKSMDYCMLTRNKFLKRKKISKYVKSTLCKYAERAKKRFSIEKRSLSHSIQPKDDIFAKEELKLMCYHCNSSDLKIASFHENGIIGKGFTCSCEILSNELKKDRIRTGDHVTKYSTANTQRDIPRCSKKSCCTCHENKRRISKCSPEQLSHAANVKWKNDVVQKSHPVVKDKDNILSKKEVRNDKFNTNLGGNHKNKSTTICNDAENAKVTELKENMGRRRNQFIDCKFEGITSRKEKTHASCYIARDGTDDMKDGTDITIPSYAKFDAAELSSSKSDKASSTSDNGSYADVSNCILYDNFDMVAHDALSVTSITFLRRLNDAIPGIKMCRVKKAKKPLHNSHRLCKENRQRMEKWTAGESKKSNNFPQRRNQLIVVEKSSDECHSARSTESDDV